MPPAGRPRYSCTIGSISISSLPSITSSRRYNVRLMRWSVTRPCGSCRYGYGRYDRRCPAGYDGLTLPPADVWPFPPREYAHPARTALSLFFVLRTFVLTLHNNAGWQVGNTDGGVGGVNVLTPAPEERKVSIRRSAGLMSGSSASGSSGITATVQAEV